MLDPGLLKRVAERVGLGTDGRAALDRAKTGEYREKDDHALISELETLYLKAERAQSDTERIWRENIAFLEGLQHIVGQQDLLVNVQGHAPDRIVDNRVLDMARRLHARLDQPAYMPSTDAITDEPNDHDAAKAGHAFLRNFYIRRKVQREKRLNLWWIIACGHFFLEPYFDDQGGKLIDVPKFKSDEHGDPVLDPTTGLPELEMEEVRDEQTGLPVIESVQVQEPDPLNPGQFVTVTQQRPKLRIAMTKEREGIIDFVARSPFQVKRDYRVQEWRKAQWVFVDETPPREQTLMRYADAYRARTGLDLDTKLPKTEKVKTLPYLPELSGYTSDQTGLPKPPPAAEDVNVIRRFYQLPTREYPNGRVAIYNKVGNLVLHRGDLDEGTLPLHLVGYLIRPWILEGMSPTHQVRMLQRMLNYIIGRWWMHLRAWAGGWPIIPTTAGISKETWTNEIGSGLFYNPAGGKPEFLGPPFGNLVAYANFVQKVESSMEERMALPPALRGQMPKGAKGFKIVELLQEQADAVQAPAIADIADAFGEFYAAVLGLARRHYKTERMVAIVGPSNTAAVRAFKGDQIPEDWQDRITVRVAAGESLPSSAAIRREVIQDMARKDKIFGEPGTPEFRRKYLEALRFEEGTFASQSDLDETIANEENYQILAGADVHINEGVDDSAVHLMSHLTFMKSLIAQGRKADAARFAPHVTEHRNDLAKQVLEAKAIQGHQEQPGQPGAKPGHQPPHQGNGHAPHSAAAHALLTPGAEPQPTKHGPSAAAGM